MCANGLPPNKPMHQNGRLVKAVSRPSDEQALENLQKPENRPHTNSKTQKQLKISVPVSRKQNIHQNIYLAEVVRCVKIQGPRSSRPRKIPIKSRNKSFFIFSKNVSCTGWQSDMSHTSKRAGHLGIVCYEIRVSKILGFQHAKKPILSYGKVFGPE